MVKLPTFFYLPTRCNFVPDNLKNITSIGMSKMACFDLRVGHSPLVRGEIICSCHMPIGEKKNQNICARKCYSFVFKDNIMTISFASVHFFLLIQTQGVAKSLQGDASTHLTILKIKP